MQQDFFALLGQPRRPWLDPIALKERFHEIAAREHPDVAGDSKRFAQINAAYALLANPAARLRHLLELEAPEQLAGELQIPETLGEEFLRIATLRRTVDAFTKQRAKASTPLGQAVLAGELFTLERDVEKELAGLQTQQQALLAQVQDADAAWDADGAALVPLLAELQQALTFVDKWTAQLREVLFALQSPG